MSLRVALERTAVGAARLAWPAIRAWIDRRPGKPLEPRWADGPLLRGEEQTWPRLGWPRETDSLCPLCVRETRKAILDGERDWQSLLERTPGEIKATIRERDGRVVMEKACPRHGAFSDVMAIDPAFLARIEGLHQGSDFRTSLTALRNHGSSTITLGRGAVLTVDLTNRCNMMCDACFMDANQVGYVHELTLPEIQKILDDALSVKPRRQMSINFSGGEPTISPIFLDAVRYARDVGYFAIQASTNGIRFATEPEFAFAAKDAGLRIAYLQFDGTTNETHAHRRIGNLFDLKLRALENLAAADIDVVLVPTILNGVNDHQVGDIVRFAVEHADKVTVISFQPVSFTGRDEEIDDVTRAERRYTLSHLAHDIARQTGYTEPMRDWFPLSAMGPFSDLVDLVQGPTAEFGSLKCGCHPNCGIGTALFVNKRTKEVIPLSEIVDLEQLMRDVRAIADAQRAQRLTMAQIGLALLRNYRPERSPIPVSTLMRQFLSQTGADGLGGEKDSHGYEWRVLFVAGMWFQDLFNYDFRRTERCIIPYGTQMGEISFCAYNTGVGWRQIVEDIHQVARVQDWYESVGRHPVYANGRPIPLPEVERPGELVPLRLNGKRVRMAGESRVEAGADASGTGKGVGSGNGSRIAREHGASPPAHGGGGDGASLAGPGAPADGGVDASTG